MRVPHYINKPGYRHHASLLKHKPSDNATLQACQVRTALTITYFDGPENTDPHLALPRLTLQAANHPPYSSPH
jgi:hypothetical protein